MENKLTDNEIIKALECCIVNDCDNCPLDYLSTFKDCLGAFKAEIERLKAHNKEYRFCNLVDNVLIYSKTLEDYNNFRKAIKPKQGKWLINPDGYFPYCSECKAEPEGRKMTKFCPECGADMRGEKNEQI